MVIDFNVFYRDGLFFIDVPELYIVIIKCQKPNGGSVVNETYSEKIN